MNITNSKGIKIVSEASDLSFHGYYALKAIMENQKVLMDELITIRESISRLKVKLCLGNKAGNFFNV